MPRASPCPAAPDLVSFPQINAVALIGEVIGEDAMDDGQRYGAGATEPKIRLYLTWASPGVWHHRISSRGGGVGATAVESLKTEIRGRKG